jgi:hypothetical protein
MRVNEKSDFSVEFTEGGKGGKRNGNEIANAGDIENNLIGTFFEEAAAEESDHRMKVLLCWEEVSTDGSGGVVGFSGYRRSNSGSP